jgi:hypothetical protein
MSNAVSCFLKAAIEPRDPPVALTGHGPPAYPISLGPIPPCGASAVPITVPPFVQARSPAARGYLVADAGGLAHVGSIAAAQGHRRAHVVVNAPLGLHPRWAGPTDPGAEATSPEPAARMRGVAARAMLLHRHFVRDIVGSQALLSLSRAALWRSAYLFSP